MDDKMRIERIEDENNATQVRVTELLGETKKECLKSGAWTAEENQKLAHGVQIYGPRLWKTFAAKAGLKRGAKSCRLRWMNYLRPNIKRGNISDQEEDLILRLHKLLGNRWSLIAGRLPGRTDNEIKNYWNSHLSKKVKQKENKHNQASFASLTKHNCCKFTPQLLPGMRHTKTIIQKEETSKISNDMQSKFSFNVDDFFDFSNENPSNLELISRFLQVD